MGQAEPDFPPMVYEEPPFFYEDDYFPEADPYTSEPPPLDLPPLSETPEATAAWHDARLIGVDRGADAGDKRYEIGAIDLYTDAATGDLSGHYLPLTAFADEDSAVDHFHGLERQAHRAGMSGRGIVDFAEAQLTADTVQWQAATAAEHVAYAHIRDDFDLDVADIPPDDGLGPLIQAGIDLGGVWVADDPTLAQDALRAIGVASPDFDPATNPPPFYDAEADIAYWIGVFQPDADDRDNCITSILSLGRDPESGVMEAQLAPCVPGDYDKANAAAEYLIQVAERGGIEQVFDTAEGMALATDQHAFWQTGRGVPLEPDAAHGIAAGSEMTR